MTLIYHFHTHSQIFIFYLTKFNYLVKAFIVKIIDSSRATIIVKKELGVSLRIITNSIGFDFKFSYSHYSCNYLDIIVMEVFL